MISSEIVLQKLRNLRSYDGLLSLFETLGFTYANESRSMVDWAEAIRQDVSEYRLAAKHGAFSVFYIVIPSSHMFSRERQITTKVLATEPHSLIIFTDPSHNLWHLVHVRYDEKIERRQQLRRFVVDLGDERAANRLRTTAERLTLLAIQPNETISALEMQKRCDEAFRISEITRGFLKSFVGVVADLTTDLQKNNPVLLKTEQDALQQAQLLMDRLVFLYFVQKKGWLNGEQAYLYSRFRKCYETDHGASTFYRERLLPLFHSLSNRAAQRPHTDKGTVEALPFLNGGLFDLPLSYGTTNPSVDERLYLPNESLYPVFEDFLEVYNFTTTEDTPLDVEVAINPEVIGTIFETFVLTSENEADTNAPDRRKATGSYYTPRCVVHFICQAVFRRYLANRSGIAESVVKNLIEFLPATQLSTEEEKQLVSEISVKDAGKLRDAAFQMRACDPAVGSGAFPVGLLQEVVKLISLLDLRINGKDYIQTHNYAHDLKKRIIEECLYGVDIQEQAVQICELRLWLSLVVDYETDEKLPLIQRIAQIEPLPNLTFRIRVGDSLLDQLFGHDREINAARHDDLVTELTTRKRSYYESQSAEGKQDLERQIILLQLQLLERLLEAERLETGVDLPMLDAMMNNKQRLKIEQIKLRLKEIDDLLKQCREAMQTASQPITLAWEHTRRFDNIRKELGVSFIWELDFAEAFDPSRNNNGNSKRGFDVIVGNPPFVTARNPDKNRRYRKRWPTSCYMKYHLLAPFTELAIRKLLRQGGQIGYIVSNGFATRDFGKPLVEEVLRSIELQNVVDCSGLMFPGHGTPTCIILGYTTPTRPELATTLCGTKPGMGQLKEEAEETQLWKEIEDGWELPEYSGNHIGNAKWDTNTTRSHPWSLNAFGTKLKISLDQDSSKLRKYLVDDIGVATMTNCDEVFINAPDIARRLIRNPKEVSWYLSGQEVRDYSTIISNVVLSLYSDDWNLKQLENLTKFTREYLEHFYKILSSRRDFADLTYAEKGRPWWEFHQVSTLKYKSRPWLAYDEIATHLHVAAPNSFWKVNRTAMVISINSDTIQEGLVKCFIGSSSALFYLKQICFCKRYSDNPETADYYVYGGGKIEQLPIPHILIENESVKERGNKLADKCSLLGMETQGLYPRKIFERSGEAYIDWYRCIDGYQVPDRKLNCEWQTAKELLTSWQHSLERVHTIRKQMIALQEEMDWLIYSAYGLLPLSHPAVNLNNNQEPFPIDRLERPYRLTQNNQSIPIEWDLNQKNLWRARIDAVHANESVGQLENPAYKRRWEEPFGNKDFLGAYEWWLREKAEWLLENKHKGGPIHFDFWADELWKDIRVQAAYQAAMEIGEVTPDARYQQEHAKGVFAIHLKRIIEEETVPDRRDAFKKKHDKLRGIDPEKHLPNGVPRERFRSIADKPGYYVWSGKDIWGGVEGDNWNG